MNALAKRHRCSPARVPLVALVLLTGCPTDNNDDVFPPVTQTLLIGPQVITVTLGTTVVFEIQGGPAGDYTWKVDSADAGVLISAGDGAAELATGGTSGSFTVTATHVATKRRGDASVTIQEIDYGFRYEHSVPGDDDLSILDPDVVVQGETMFFAHTLVGKQTALVRRALDGTSSIWATDPFGPAWPPEEQTSIGGIAVDSSETVYAFVRPAAADPELWKFDSSLVQQAWSPPPADNLVPVMAVDPFDRLRVVSLDGAGSILAIHPDGSVDAGAEIDLTGIADPNDLVAMDVDVGGRILLATASEVIMLDEQGALDPVFDAPDLPGLLDLAVDDEGRAYAAVQTSLTAPVGTVFVLSRSGAVVETIDAYVPDGFPLVDLQRPLAVGAASDGRVRVYDDVDVGAPGEPPAARIVGADSQAPPQEIRVTIDPPSVLLRAGQTTEFTATVEGLSDPTVTWSTIAGSLKIGANPNIARFIASGAIGSFELVATSNEDPSKSATAVIALTAFNYGFDLPFAGFGVDEQDERADIATGNGIYWYAFEPPGSEEFVRYNLNGTTTRFDAFDGFQSSDESLDFRFNLAVDRLGRCFYLAPDKNVSGEPVRLWYYRATQKFDEAPDIFDLPSGFTYRPILTAFETATPGFNNSFVTVAATATISNALVRLDVNLSSGTITATVLADLGGSSPGKIAIDTENRIVMASASGNHPGFWDVLERRLPDGSIDPEFDASFQAQHDVFRIRDLDISDEGLLFIATTDPGASSVDDESFIRAFNVDRGADTEKILELHDYEFASGNDAGQDNRLYDVIGLALARDGTLRVIDDAEFGQDNNDCGVQFLFLHMRLDGVAETLGGCP